ncbi:KTSC domain-containing protein [Microbacterium sp. zg.B48]|uniref:KTSC domain-containing protein n=1 Tax=unclassified Microbacterium TaxID=2609290 RepID=UPI00214AA89E|nr:MULTISPECIES: KTSC domain-containing protein [unclassified Microbacterium]MCR2763746.1 KTSC domain-containing protein [Microbacterium sp. zg.B48]MCR2809466.1 KTSC domain-containing protein [Microbacterium sp. zg.B185]WIM20600.1 KTSC domain-containing protein [Microbacterium sp. zg-B185]
MRRAHVDSSALASVGYDPQTAELEIEFVSGDVYRYFAVPARVHRDLLAAASKGRFFRDRIRDRYPAQRVRPR